MRSEKNKLFEASSMSIKFAAANLPWLLAFSISVKKSCVARVDALLLVSMLDRQAGIGIRHHRLVRWFWSLRFMYSLTLTTANDIARCCKFN